MLTKRQNMIETMKVGGHPDRFVNGYEALGLVMGSPFGKRNPNPKPGELNVVNAWGITKSWPKGTPGAFPVHTPETSPGPRAPRARSRCIPRTKSSSRTSRNGRNT